MSSPGQYEIRVKSHLDARWADWFHGLHLSHGRDGTTVICEPIPDQASTSATTPSASEELLPAL
ncbi:MAG: hypothetical protein M9890_11500 [Thermomicrobiales bacterium]|nr:hypothetical protein [Thermomicrobiales bacterium]